MKASIVPKRKMQPFYYQKSSTKRDTNTRGVEGQPQQIYRDHCKFQGKQRVWQIPHSHITSDFTNKELKTAACNRTGEKLFSSATFLFLTYQQKWKGMAGVESFFSNEGTEVTSYNSGQPSSFFMLGGKRQLLYFVSPWGCQLAVLLERIKMQCQGELLEEWD